MVHIYSGILLSHINEEIMPFSAIWMDQEIIRLSEVSQMERQISYDITDKCNLKRSINELNYQTEVELHI